MLFRSDGAAIQTTLGAAAAISGQIRSRSRGRSGSCLGDGVEAIYEAREEVRRRGLNSKFMAAAFLAGSDRDGELWRSLSMDMVALHL